MPAPILDRLRSNAPRPNNGARPGGASGRAASRAASRDASGQDASGQDASGDGAVGRPLRGASSARGAGGPVATRWQRHGTALPGWSDLRRSHARTLAGGGGGEAAAAGGSAPRRAATGFLLRVETIPFALVVLSLAALFVAYVGHVHATQELVSEVQAARRTNRMLHLKHNRLRGDYDRATGPAVIHERARALGLDTHLQVGPAVRLPPASD